MSYDYYQFFDGRRKAHKEYKCEACGLVIPEGSVYSRREYAWEGCIIQERLHNHCRAEMQMYFDETRENEFDWYDIHEFVDETIRWYGHLPRWQQEEQDELEAE